MKTFPKPLSAAKEKEYLDKCMQGDKEARNLLVEHNLRLVAHVIKKYAQTDIEMDDLLSIGTIGLIKAVSTYNPDKSNRLATYAGRCIENEVLMVLRAHKKQSREVSLYEPIGTDKEGNEIHLVDIIEAEDKDIVEDLIQKNNCSHLYQILMNTLTKRECQIIILRYGLLNDVEITQREIAQKLNISRSYVSRIEKKALEKLKYSYQNIKL